MREFPETPVAEIGIEKQKQMTLSPMKDSVLSKYSTIVGELKHCSQCRGSDGVLYKCEGKEGKCERLLHADCFVQSDPNLCKDCAPTNEGKEEPPEEEAGNEKKMSVFTDDISEDGNPKNNETKKKFKRQIKESNAKFN